MQWGESCGEKKSFETFREPLFRVCVYGWVLSLTRIYETSTKQNGAGIVNREGKDVERRPASDLSVWEGAGNAVKKRSLAISAFECPWAVPRLLLV